MSKISAILVEEDCRSISSLSKTQKPFIMDYKETYCNPSQMISLDMDNRGYIGQE